MKSIKSLIYGAVALMSLGLVSCQDDWDDPQANAPVAINKPNTTIADLKKAFWQDETNYIQTIGNRPDGSHYIISGRVISSDESGNVFKSLFIQDETGVLPFSINQYNLYMRYRIGQEIVVDATDMYIGKYNGLQQIGYPEWYENGKCWEASFMAPALFESHIELNGFPEKEKVDTITIKDFSTLGSSVDELIRWQGQLVRFNDCYWAAPGTTICDEYHSSGYSQTLNVQGGSVTVRTSGYSKFWNYVLPEEHMDVVGILSYYGTTGWQLILNDVNGLMNVGTPTLTKGIKENPYTVPEVIAFEEAGEQESGWVSGYIVGAVAPGVTSVTKNEDIEWTADVTMKNTLVIAPTPETTEFSQCLVVLLPEGSSFRSYGNLADNPDNYKKAIKVSGNFAAVLDTWGVADNYGSADEYEIEGVTPGGGGTKDGDGSEESPFSSNQVIEGTANRTGVWVSGYIVGWIDGKSLSDGAKFDNAATVASNLLIAASIDETDYTKCVPLQLPIGSVRDGLNLQANPGNYKKLVSVKGDIQTYFGVNGVKTITEYKLDGEGGGTTPDPTPSGDKKFTKATSIVGGNSYLMYIPSAGIAATAVDATKTYGYLYTQAVTETSGTITASSALGFTFEATTGGYFIKDTTGRYLYMTGTFNSFNMADAPNASDAGYIWVVAIQGDGTAQIMNTGMSKWIQYSAQYTSFGAYNSQSGENPVLYVMEGGSSGGGTTPEPTPEPTPGTGEGSADSPFAVNQVISGAASGTGVWVKGFIVGWIDGKSLADGAKFNGEATIQTNLLLADNANETDYTKCIPVQLPAGAVRTALNLQTNPGNYKKEVSLKGDIATYFGAPGLKTVTEYSLDGSSSGGGDTPAPTPEPGGDATFAKATSVAAGNTILMYIPSAGIAATAIDASKTYGYLYTQAVTETSGTITASSALGFTLEATTGGFFIKDSNGRYLFMKGTYNSFNVADTADASDSGYIWTVTIQADGTAQIMNTGMSKWIQYSASYTSFGSYNSQSGENPVIYVKK